MNDRERMLAEGPREAPEPMTAEGVSSAPAPPPAARPSAPAAPAAPGRPRLRSSAWYRIIPIALIAALTGARALGDGFTGLAFVGVILAAGLIEYLRRRSR